MSIEDSINNLAQEIGRLASIISRQSESVQASGPAGPPPVTTPVETVKPKAEPAAPAPDKPELPIATASEVVAAATAAPAAAAPTYDTTRTLMLQVSEKFGRDTVIGLLAQCGLQDLKKGTAAQFAAVTAAATAQLAGA